MRRYRSVPLIEITDIPPLAPGEESLVELHSVLNTLAVLKGELQLLGLLAAEDPALLPVGLAACEQMLGALTDREQALHQAMKVPAHEAAVFEEINTVFARWGDRPPPEHLPEALDNLRSVFDILRVRASEVLARAAAPGRWQKFNSVEVLAGNRQFFEAVAKNCKGRYGIVFNAARQQPSDYYVDLKVETETDGPLLMPPVLGDVMRDLMANARKYTPPGGTIIAALYAEPHRLGVVVADTGRGIPPGEIETVVHFGKRASNVADVRSLGGGFGLTKAFLTAKRFGGRFWIESTLGAGTRVRLELPFPGVG